MEQTLQDNGDQLWLLNCLNATLDTNHDIRSSAEQSLKQAETHPGFGVALAKVTVNQELPLALRQLAAVLLKQYVRQHWEEGEKNYVSPAEKGIIRKLLVHSLDDPHGKICTAVGMAVASIAQYDWPEHWPELMTILLRLITDQSNMNGIRGALKCLGLISGDLDDNLLPKLIPTLFPCLFDIVSAPNVYDKSMRRKALAILHSCISTLGVMSGAFETETRELLNPILKSWLHQFSLILLPPVPTEDPEDWCLRMEVLKSVSQLVQHFQQLLVPEFEAFLASLWQTFTSCLKVYESASVKGIGDSYAGRTDSDGSDESLEALAIQLFELLLTVVGNKKLSKFLKKHANELVYYSIAYMQITENQAESWVEDANQYVCDEDEMQYNCRISCMLLLEELVGMYKISGIHSVIDAAVKRMEEAYLLKSSGTSDWWKLREAAVLAIGSISEHILDFQIMGMPKLNFETFMDDLLAQDINLGIEYPLLQARAFWAISKFSAVINKNRHEQFVYAAMRALAMDISPPVKVGACKALSKILPEANAEVLQPHMDNVFSSIASLLKHASDETLHLLLDTLQALIKADEKSSVAAEPFITPLILDVWAKNVFDPFISIDAIEVLEAVKTVPGCLHPLISRALPTIERILANPQQHPVELLAGTLDLLTMFLKNTPSDVVKIIGDACFFSVISIILGSDDHSILQNATECLSAFVLWGKDVLLNPENDTNSMARMLFEAAARLLNPEMDSSGSLFVGSYILQLILYLPSYITLYMKELVKALVRRMETSNILGLKTSLLLVFARLVHLSAANIHQFIDLLLAIPINGHQNSLHYVMSEWTKQQGEIHGAYQIKVTITALCHILGSLHPELFRIHVRGRLVQSSVSGIVTRSRSKVSPDQWTTMPLPSKILSLLAEMLIELEEQNANVEDEDDEWEELEGDEDDTDVMQFMNPSSTGRPTLRQMENMKDILKEEEGDGFEDDPLTVGDPLNEIEPASCIINFLRALSANNKQLLDHLWKDLTDREKHVIETSLVKCGSVSLQ